MRTCHSGAISCAVTKTRRTSSGTSAMSCTRPVLRHRLHQRLAVEAALPRHRLEVGIHEGQVSVPHDVAVRHREERFDPRRAAGDDADRPGGGDGRHRGVPERAAVPVNALGPVRERTPLLRQPRRLVPADRGDELHDLAAQIQRGLTVVGNPELDQEVRPAHHAETDPAVPVDLVHDLRQRVRVHLDHVVQETHPQANRPLQRIPGDRRRRIARTAELVQIDGARGCRRRWEPGAARRRDWWPRSSPGLGPDWPGRRSRGR